MTPVKFIRCKIWFPVWLCTGIVLLSVTSQAQSAKTTNYLLQIQLVDKDNAFNLQPLKLQTRFANRDQCTNYINGLGSFLSAKGYPTASVDSIFEMDDRTVIQLFLGKQYQWIKLTPDGIDKAAMDEGRFKEKDFAGKLLNIQQLLGLQEKILQYYEKNGYPFAAVFLDSIRLDEEKMEALLRANKGPLYHVDSIRIIGKGKISKKFLGHYLGIPNGSLYNKEKLDQVGRRMLELPYVQEVQPNDVTMLGTGSVLNLYLANKRSSQANFLIGFLPNGSEPGKLQLTADVNLDLKNALNNGESILFKYQQLQPKSPRLNLGFQQPYIFNTGFGFDFLFDLFKKDSSFLQINALAGLQYLLSANQSGKLFVQWQNSFLLGTGVDTNLVKATKKLPPNIDVTAVNVGLDYEWSKTDFKLNPRKGNEVKVTASVGIKNIKQNSEILNIKDPAFDYASLYDSVKSRAYQFRLKLGAAHFFPVGKQATVKAAVNGGLFISPSTFRNELFQIGGYKLLRGFSEESIYATQYAVLTAEYRYRLGLNSYMFGFIDAGWVKNKYQTVDQNNNFVGAGLGLAFETRFGLLNISYAAGKRNDQNFSLRDASKIHFGYVNYF
ncbi:MAG: BamA/TamA family outer membrane protein [Chitinophagaceae bacterium]|nr:BamA/TamA family outer membrane protein [Chitinophagaceae bacterium]